MTRFGMLFTALALTGLAIAQSRSDSDFRLALPDHRGQLRWSAEGFKIVQSSAKPNGREIGIRGRDETGRLTFLGFLFLVSEQAPLTSTKCRENALQPEKNGNPTLKIKGTSENTAPSTLPVSVVTYTAKDASGTTLYMLRGFVATGDMCGDLEFYSNTPVSPEDADVKKILASYRLDENYIPRFNDVLLYAQTLYKTHMYKAAAPVF